MFPVWPVDLNVGVSKNNGTPKSSILIGFSIIFTIHFWVPIFLETSMSIFAIACFMGDRDSQCLSISLLKLFNDINDGH